jgi:hypothetical protein
VNDNDEAASSPTPPDPTGVKLLTKIENANVGFVAETVGLTAINDTGTVVP